MMSTVWAASYADDLPNLQSPREQVLDCAVDGFTSRCPVKVFCFVVPLLLTTFNLENKAFYYILTAFWCSKYENAFENQTYVAQMVRKNERH